ncbi:hypothetical protein EVAR_28675_1 [Eumeta japonica]|uniref:Uncharacterized protein n=1 Tax=Eumeta variegata TaxID=151549 RepID=A0A4C1V4T7_EUMVA|nr:hypothetical protein EVAR_28675_1 [Eumeta japonica]
MSRDPSDTCCDDNSQTFGITIPARPLKLSLVFHANKAHLQETADSHIHQGARSAKTTNTTSPDRPLSCNGQRATKTSLRQPQITTDRHACQMSQTNHHQH